MRTVTITSRAADFAAEMVEMRTCLDQHMFEPARFTYKQDGEVIAISVDFQRNDDAKAFKHHFDSQPKLDVQLRNACEPISGAAGADSGRTKTPGTMAQACWWRLLAEEVRTEADNFASESARETMEIAARGWEQLAEELERRLAGRIGQ